MANIKGRNLFAAILVARAICGIGAAQAQTWTVVAKDPGPGRTVTGSVATLPNVVSYLYHDPTTGNVIYNDVTLDLSGSSTTNQIFANGPTDDVLHNSLTVQGGGWIDVSGGPAVAFYGDRVSFNTVTVDPSGSIDANNGGIGVDVSGVLVSGNTVVNAGLIEGTTRSIEFLAGTNLVDNYVDNSGTLSGEGRGIYMTAGGDITGSGRVDASGNLLDSITNSGTIGIYRHGIYLDAGQDIKDFQITNTEDGVIEVGYSTSEGIILEAGRTISGTKIDNQGEISAGNAGIYYNSINLRNNTVTNSGSISTNGDGISLNAQADSDANILTNSGTIEAISKGMYIYDASGSVTGSTLTNASGGSISVDPSGDETVALGLEAYYGDAKNNTLTNAGSLSGACGMAVLGGGNATLNTMTNASGGTITASEVGMYLAADDDNLDHNTVVNAGTITVREPEILTGKTDLSGNGVGIALDAEDSSLTDNTVTNTGTGQIAAYGNGISLTASESVSRNTVTNAGSIDASGNGDGIYFYSDDTDVNGNTVHNSGTIAAYSHGIEMYAEGGNLEGNTITLDKATDLSGGTLSAGTLSAGPMEIVSLDADGVHLFGNYNVTGNTVTNAGGIEAGNGSGIVIIGGEKGSGGDFKNNIVTNSGTIEARYEGVYLGATYTVESNTVTNSGTLTLRDLSGNSTGIELYSGSANVKSNTVTNALGGVITVGAGGSGIGIEAEDGMVSNNTLTNAGAINAAAVSGPPEPLESVSVSRMPGVTGIDIWGMHGVDGNTVTNSGSINLGDFAAGIDIESPYDLTGNTVVNSGSIATGFLGCGVLLQSYEYNTTGNTVLNASGATITVSDGSGCGIAVLGAGDVMGNQVTNAGTISLGNGSDPSANFFPSMAGIVVGSMETYLRAQDGYHYGTVSGNTVTNAGTIDVNMVDPSGAAFAAGIVVGRAGYTYPNGFATQGVSDLSGVVMDNTVINSGTINVDVSLEVQTGPIQVGGIVFSNFSYRIPEAPIGVTAISGNTVVNSGEINVTGVGDGLEAGIGIGFVNQAMKPPIPPPINDSLQGAVDSVSFGTFGNTVTNSGDIYVDGGYAGLAFHDNWGVSENAITNSGRIQVVTGDYGYGVTLEGNSSNSIGNSLTNSGRISLEGSGTAVFFSGINDSSLLNLGTIEATGTSNWSNGVEVYGNGNTITNWGKISATTTDPSGGVEGIYVSGSGNVVNLNGHSSVQGKITGIGVDPSGGPLNTLNLNFTGLSPETMAALKATIASQVDPVTGMPTTTDGTVRFTVRGVNYVVDPMLIDPHLLSSYELQGETGNQSSVGANLDSLTTNPDPGTDLWKLLYAVDNSGEVPKALGELSPQRYQIYGDIAVSQMSGISQQVDNRLVALYDGDMPEKKGNLWATIGHKSATVDGIGHDLENAKFSTDSVVVGADYRVSPAFTLGALFHYSTTDHAKMDEHGSRADVDSKGVGVYAGFRQGGIYANGLVTYSNNDYESSRKVAFTGYDYTAKGDTSGHQTGVGIDGGYDFKVSDALTVGPFGGLQYVHLSVDGFKEKGAPAANLAVDSQTMTSLLGRVGGRLNYTASMGGMNTFGLDLHAALQHEFKNDARNIRAKFIGSGLDAFSVKTEATDRNSFLLGVGFNFNFHGTTSVFANYDMQGGQSNWHEQNIKGGVKISF